MHNPKTEPTPSLPSTATPKPEGHCFRHLGEDELRQAGGAVRRYCDCGECPYCRDYAERN
jgi:hypothetical protein